MKNSKEKARKDPILLFLGMVLLFVTVFCLLYFMFGHQLVKAMYEGKAIGLLNRIIQNPEYPLKMYFNSADRWFLKINILIIAVTIILISTHLVTRMIWKKIAEKGYGNILGRIFVTIIFIFSLFFLVDFTLGFFLAPRINTPFNFLGSLFRVKPYIMASGREYSDFTSTEKLNRLGYRGKLPDKIKKKGEFRIFILGASTAMWGDVPIPVLLENEFRAKGFSNVNVYNFGMATSVSSMDLARILFEISDFEPNLIIMYNGPADILQSYLYDPRPGYPLNFLLYENNPLFKIPKEYPGFTLFLYSSNTIRTLFSGYFRNKFFPLAQIRKEVSYKSEEWKNEIAKVYADNLIKANKISKAFDSEFIAFFAPTPYSKKKLSPEEKEYVSQEYKDYFSDMHARIFSQINGSDKDKPRIIDLGGIYDTYPDTVYMDIYGHTYQKGREIVAKEIFKDIIDLVKTKEQNASE